MSGDPGLFGPSSVTWHLHGDPAMWLAGVRALYLQALHPATVRGVIQNSDFQNDPLGRLLRTASFVGVSTYGTRPDVERAAARVRKVHRALSIRHPDGSKSTVDDPKLLLWVHCAEVVSYLEITRGAGFPLTDAQADRYLDEQRGSAELVGLDPDLVPGSRAEMSAYFAAMRPELRRTPESDEIYRFLMWPPLSGWMRYGLLGWKQVSRICYSALPGWAVRLYGRPALPPAVTTAALRAARVSGLAIPAAVRRMVPPGHVNKAIRRLGVTATPARRVPVT